MKNLNRTHNLTGMRFGRLTVLGIDDRATRKTYWVCQCECGNIKIARSDALLSGATKSCGCLKKEQDKKNLGKTKHGHINTRLYHTWQGMKGRCSNPNNPRYSRYGGRGIKVCEEWEHSFQAFYEWAMENGYSDDLTIDRIDNDKGYSPDNCRWATSEQQARNRSTNIEIKIGKVTKTMIEWCEIFQLDFNMVNARYHRNPDITLDELFKEG